MQQPTPSVRQKPSPIRPRWLEIINVPKPIIVGIGTINMVTANTNATLALRWLLTYIPLDDGASVVAA